jgi:hypothetical protein
MKVVFVILFTLFSLVVSSQKRNTIYICFQPNDLGYGLRYDYSFNGIGIYNSVTYGGYQFAQARINNHLKLSSGVMIFNKRKLYTGDYNLLSIGLSYNHYRGTNVWTSTFNPKAFKPVSLEIGAGTVVNRFSVAFRYELIKNNVSLDFGYKF